MADRPTGFVALKSLTRGTPDPKTALAEIRRIYFATTKRTIEHDFAHAIELLKGLPDEDTRDKAAVFMEGLNEMRRQWEKERLLSKVKGPKARAKDRGRGKGL